MRVFLILLGICILGIFLRLVNISSYKYYPDAYQSLVVAKNITDFNSVVGGLGREGSIYPPALMWTKPVYPILINLLGDAPLVALLMGVLTIPLAYLFGKTIFNSPKAGVISAFLLAISFDHTLWSAYLMSDTTGIFFAFAYFSLLIYRLDKKSDLLNLADLATGLLLTLSVFSRFEYVIFIIPSLFLLLNYSAYRKNKIINIALSFILTSSVFLFKLFPVSQTFEKMAEQLSSLTVQAAVLLLAFIALYIVSKQQKFSRLLQKVPRHLKKVFIALAFLSLLLQIPTLNIPYFTGLSNFIRHDFLLMFLALLGLGFMFEDKKYFKYAVFSLLYIVLMYSIYLRINPLQQRYVTHLTLGLMIPATFAVTKVLTVKKRILYIIAILVVILQISLTSMGIKYWDNGDWTKKSYEEVSARIVGQYLTGEEIIYSALPEPYFIFTGHSSQYIGMYKPYIRTALFDDNREIIIVNDMSMATLFPEFSEFLDTELTSNKIAEYETDIHFRYKTDVFSEDKPIKIYRIKVGEFEAIAKD